MFSFMGLFQLKWFSLRTILGEINPRRTYFMSKIYNMKLANGISIACKLQANRRMVDNDSRYVILIDVT